MKKIILTSMLASTFLLAQENFIEIGLGYKGTKNNFSTDSDEKISTFSKAKSDNSVLPNLKFYYGQEISKDINLFIKSDQKELKLGSKIAFDNSNLSFGFKTKLFEEEWEDPFLLNTNRKETDISENGLFLAYQLPFNNYINTTISYEYAKKKYDSDKLIPVLKRDANIHNLSLKNIFILDYANIITNIEYEKYNAKGKASSYDKIGLDLGISKTLNPKTTFSLFAGYAKKEYDQSNPVLNKKIDANIFKSMANIKYKEPFDYKNTYIKTSLIYKNEDANNQFYDKTATYGLFSIGYNF